MTSHSFFLKCILVLMLLVVTTIALAGPRISVEYGMDRQKFVKIKVKNETRRTLACYVAINGIKKKFKLTALAKSRWYRATDERFNYTDFSVFCDYIEYVDWAN